MSNRKSNQLSCWQPSAANTRWLVPITILSTSSDSLLIKSHVRVQKGAGGRDPLKNGFLSNTDPDPLKNSQSKKGCKDQEPIQSSRIPTGKLQTHS